MSSTTLQISSDPNSLILLPEDSNKDKRHRLRKFVGWLNATDSHWAMPDLRRYRNYLLRSGLSPESAAVHLSSVRSRYRELLLDRRLFYTLVPAQSSFAEQKALVDELIARLEAAVDPRSAPLRTKQRQDRPDADNLRLSQAAAREMLNQPDTTTLSGIRDRALIALLLCTGIREAELCSLVVHDLEQRLDGQLALHVRAGKGMKERLIPYGSLRWCLPIVRRWLSRSGVVSGPVFRGLRKGDNVRKTALNERSVQKILARYPVWIDGQPVIVRPHDCRRTYARWLYDAGVKIDAIRQNMGHESIQMTFRYIGSPDVEDRLPPPVFTP